MKSMKIGLAALVLGAVLLVGSVSSPKPAAAMDGLCNFMFAKLHLMQLMIDGFGIPYRDVQYDYQDVVTAIGELC